MVNIENSEDDPGPKIDIKPNTPNAIRDAIRQFAALQVGDGQRRFLRIEKGMTIVGIVEEKPIGDNSQPVIIESTTTIHQDLIKKVSNDYNA